MLRAALGLTLWGVAALAHAQAGNCAALLAAPAMAEQPTLATPLAAEFGAPLHSLGTPSGVLSQALDEAMSVDQVLLRLRLQGCQVAKAAPASTGMPSSTDPAAYKPQTAFDNTPWRFDMNQNGKRMTAEEFDLWMKARGVRVAKGAGAAAAPVAAPSAVPAAQPVVEPPRGQ